MKRVAIIIVFACIVLNTIAQTPAPNTPPSPVADRPIYQSDPAATSSTPGSTWTSIAEEKPETVVFSMPIVTRRKTIEHNEDDPSYSAQGSDVVPVVYPAVAGGIQQSKYGNLKLYANTIEYYITVSVGSPAQIFTLQVDTGSAITALPSGTCTDCYHYNNLYNASLSSTSNVFSCQDDRCTSKKCNDDGTCAFKVSYGDSSFISGNLVYDVIGLPVSYNVNNGPKGSGPTVNGVTQTLFSDTPVTFGAITDQSGGFQVHGVDGIMGLAFGGDQLSCVPNCASLVMDSIVQRYNIPNVFSIALQPIQNNSIYNAVGGSLTIGGIDTAFLGGSTVYYTDVISTPYYKVLLGDISVGSTYLGARASDFGSVIVDSGTTYTLLPPAVFNMLKNVMQTQNCHLTYVGGPTSIFTNSTCVNSTKIDLSQFPDFTFHLSGVKIIMKPRQYLLELDTSKGSVNCLSVISGVSGKTVLGDSFMMGYYIVFDRDNKRVGFANDELVSAGPIITEPISKVALIAGAAGGGAAFALIIIAVVVVVLLRRRSIHRERKSVVDIGVGVRSDA